MEAQEIIDYIASAPKKTPVKVYVREREGAKVDYGPGSRVFGAGGRIVFGDWAQIGAVLEANAEAIEDYVVEADRCNSGVALLDVKGVNARIEPGAIIREKVEIGDNAVIMTASSAQHLTTAELAAVGLVGRYADLVHQRGYVEESEAMRSLVPSRATSQTTSSVPFRQVAVPCRACKSVAC